MFVSLPRRLVKASQSIERLIYVFVSSKELIGIWEYRKIPVLGSPDYKSTQFYGPTSLVTKITPAKPTSRYKHATAPLKELFT